MQSNGLRLDYLAVSVEQLHQNGGSTKEGIEGEIHSDLLLSIMRHHDGLLISCNRDCCETGGLYNWANRIPGREGATEIGSIIAYGDVDGHPITRNTITSIKACVELEDESTCRRSF